MPQKSNVIDRQVRCQKKGCRHGATEFLVLVNKNTEEETSVFVCPKHYGIIMHNALKIISKNRGK